MAKDKPEIPTSRNTDSKSDIEIAAGSVIVVGEGSELHPVEGKSKKITSGPLVRSVKNTRVEVEVLGAHIIFEPLGKGNIPKQLFDNARFKEAAEAYNLTEVKE